MGRVSEVDGVAHGVAVIPLEDVPPIELPGGSWSRVILTGDRVGSATALGYSSFAPGTATAMLSQPPRSWPTC